MFLEAGRAASRLDPASGWDQGRGHLRDFLNGLVGLKLLVGRGSSFSGLGYGLSAHQRRGFRRGTPFVTSDSCNLTLDQWLPPSQLALFVDPELRGVSPELFVPQFFNAPLAEWREALRCMSRAGLISQLSPEVVPPWLSSGAFSVRKSMESDLLIGDRRPWDSLEKMIGSPDLPRVTDLTHWYLPPASFLRVHSRDLKGHVLPVSDPEMTLAEASNGA